jgi:steroid delta-isomerase-like uncharacterized protein
MRIYLEEVIQGHAERLNDIAAVDVLDHTAVALGMRPGRDGWFDHVANFSTAISDSVIDIRRIVADEDNAVGWWTATGTHAGTFLGVPATGRKLSGQAVSFFKLRDGMVVEYELVLDVYPILRQMGVVS